MQSMRRIEKPEGGLTSFKHSARFDNARMFRLKPIFRKHLTPLEQLVMEHVWAHPHTTAEACRAGVADQRALKESTMRTVLHNLEEKGYVTHTVEGRTYVYRPVENAGRNAVVRATQQIIDRFWWRVGGRPADRPGGQSGAETAATATARRRDRRAEGEDVTIL